MKNSEIIDVPDPKDSIVIARQDKQKELLLSQIRKIPIIQISCEKISISRSTYYRWRKEDTEFAKVADISLQEWRLLINDLAESQLISAIKNKHLTAIIFWLKHNHKNYETRVTIDSQSKEDDQLTPDQEQSIKDSLNLITPNKK